MSGSTSVVSGPTPQPGQKHRSSDNFSTESLTGSSLKWTCVDTTGNTKIVFSVMHDEPNRRDETIFTSITNGTKTPMCQKSDLYIADPSGANGNFTVTIEGIG